jgi:hypothetical protein
MPACLTIPSRLVSSVAGMLVLGIVGCAQLPPTAAVTVPPIPGGAARVWFYRDLGPYDGLDTPYIRMNETIVAISEPGGASYRDVPPGQYLVTVDSYGHDFNQYSQAYLYPGHQVYFKIVTLRNWIAGGGPRLQNDFQRTTFYVWQIPAEIAQGEVARSQFYGGG